MTESEDMDHLFPWYSLWTGPCHLWLSKLVWVKTRRRTCPILKLASQDLHLCRIVWGETCRYEQLLHFSLCQSRSNQAAWDGKPGMIAIQNLWSLPWNTQQATYLFPKRGSLWKYHGWSSNNSGSCYHLWINRTTAFAHFPQTHQVVLLWSPSIFHFLGHLCGRQPDWLVQLTHSTSTSPLLLLLGWPHSELPMQHREPTQRPIQLRLRPLCPQPRLEELKESKAWTGMWTSS